MMKVVAHQVCDSPKEKTPFRSGNSVRGFSSALVKCYAKFAFVLLLYAIPRKSQAVRGKFTKTLSLCSRALLFLKYRALLVQRGPARLARGASHPGCGSQRLLRPLVRASHPAGRGPNSSSLFPPLAAVVAVAHYLQVA